MSKIARNPVPIPDGVTVEVNGQEVKAKGPKGELVNQVHGEVKVELQDIDNGKQVVVSPRSKSREAKALWGTWRSHINNMVTGVSNGFEKVLELHGVGYRANLQGQTLVLQLGFSHDVNYPVPEGIQISVDKQTKITVSGIDKRLVGQVAANIKSYRPPEPYKGKGVRYQDEYIMRKEGKKK
jgi:large subunit ribosomal protein L6